MPRDAIIEQVAAIARQREAEAKSTLAQALTHIEARLVELDKVSATWNEREASRRARRRIKARPLHEIIAIVERELDALASHFRMIKNQFAEEQQLATAWQERLVESVKRGRDDLARQAIDRVNYHQERSTRLEAEVAEWETALGDCRGILARLREDKRQRESNSP